MDAFPKNLRHKKDAFLSLGSGHLVIWRDFVWSFGVFGPCPHSANKTINSPCCPEIGVPRLGTALFVFD